MKKIYHQAFFTIVLLLATVAAGAQRGEVKGFVRDTTAFPRVANATAVLIGASDSVMEAFTRTRKDGFFTIPNIPYGNYVLIISHPNFGDYAEEITLNDSFKIVSKDFFLVQKSILINEVIIQRKRDVKVNGDTTEFNAQNYKLLENATAEDLLKMLPGIKVDKDGKITAYGETVNKVYVDGEEFFGDDPTVATKNIKAEMIDKVQLYDKKSDQEIVTGGDDGEKNTVINLKLKDEFKKGYFGKAYVGAGYPLGLDNGAMLNLFNDKRKVSGYLTQSNIGNNSLNWSDRRNYGGSGDNGMVYEDGVYYSYYSGDDDILRNGQGISNSVNGGANYSDKLLKQKLNVNSSYAFNNANRTILKNTNTEQVVNDSTYFKNELEDYKAALLQQKPVVRLVYDPDSNNKITYSVNATIKRIKLNGFYYSETLGSQKDTVNNSLRTIDQDENSQSYDQSLLWGHKFKTKGRNFSFSATLNLSDNEKLKFVKTRQQYYSGGMLNETDTLNQKNDTRLDNQSVTFKTTYTEPLGKKWFVELHYIPAFSSNKSLITSSVKDLNGEYNMRVDTLSNNFTFNANRHEGGVSFRYMRKKTNLTFTLNDEIGRQERLDLVNSVNNSLYQYNSIKPNVQLRHTFKSSMNLHLNYMGTNSQPSINQLQPVKDYTNPLRINTGNPSLKQAYRHQVNAFIHKYSIQHSKYFYASVFYTLTQRAFTTQTTFGNDGVTRYMTMNGDNVSSLSVWAQCGRSILKDMLQVSMNYSLNSGNGNSILNGIKNTNLNVGNQLGLELDYTLEKIFNISCEYSINYNSNTNKGTTVTTSQVIGHGVEADGKVYFLKHFFLQADYELEMRTSSSANAIPYSVAMMNASAGYKMFRNKAQLQLTGHNLFNQNNGYSLYQNATMITRSQHNVLGRYFLLSFTYNFTGKGAVQKDEDDDF